MAIMINNLHGAGLRTLGNRAANIAHTNNAQCFARQIGGQAKGLALAPGTALHMRMCLHNLARTVDNESIGQIGHRVHQNARRIAHRNATCCAGSDIDIIVAHTGLSDNLQLRCLR